MTYFIKRLVWVIPTFLGITILVFYLLSLSPSDPAESMLILQGIEEQSDQHEAAYEEQYQTLGLDMPLFYISVLPNYFPKDLTSVNTRAERELMKSMLKKRYNHQFIVEYLDFRKNLRLSLEEALPLEPMALKKYMDETHQESEGLSTIIKNLNTSSQALHYPVLKWHGSSNQYHHWLMNIATGDFGTSFIDGRGVSEKVSNSLVWTSLILLINFVLTLLLGIPLAIYNSIKNKSNFRIFIEQILLIFYSMPMFWIGTLVVIFLTNNYYGIKLFDLGILQQDAPFISKLISVIPIALVMTFAELAYFYNILTASLEQEKNKPYVATALAKGLSQKNVYKSHILKNAFIAPITLLLGSIPLAISGALILEVIFNVPGMGRLMFDSISKADYYVVYCIVCVVSLLAILFSLISDLVYRKLNPKIKFEERF